MSTIINKIKICDTSKFNFMTILKNSKTQKSKLVSVLSLMYISYFVTETDLLLNFILNRLNPLYILKNLWWWWWWWWWW